MRAMWLSAGLLAIGFGYTVVGADDPPKTEKPPEGWVEYAPKDKIYSVWVPKGGKRTERADWVDVKDQKVRVNILELESDGKGKFVARTLLLPPQMKGGKIAPGGGIIDPQVLTEVARDVFLKEVKGKVADEKKTKLGDWEGKEYQITIDAKTSARMRVSVLGRWIHQTAVVGTKEQVEGKDADVFFDSFRQTPK